MVWGYPIFIQTDNWNPPQSTPSLWIEFWEEYVKSILPIQVCRFVNSYHPYQNITDTGFLVWIEGRPGYRGVVKDIHVERDLTIDFSSVPHFGQHSDFVYHSNRMNQTDWKMIHIGDWGWIRTQDEMNPSHTEEFEWGYGESTAQLLGETAQVFEHFGFQTTEPEPEDEPEDDEPEEDEDFVKWSQEDLKKRNLENVNE